MGVRETNEKDAYRRLIEIGIALSAEQDIDVLLERILREAKQLVHADAGSLYLKTEQETLRFAIVLNDSLNIHQGGPNGDPISLPEIPLFDERGEENKSHIASCCLLTGASILVSDVYRDAQFDFSGPRRFDEITGYRSVSFLTLPMLGVNGEAMGVMQLINAKVGDRVGPFREEDVPMIEALSSLASVALGNRYLIEEQQRLKQQLEKEVDSQTEELQVALSKLSEAHIVLKELTTIDPVTGIRNRQYFDEVFDQEWRRAIRQSYDVSLLMLDIDHFKSVNDTYGHLAGDECLAAVAGKIDSMFNRPSDVVARYGGEEFVVILPYISLEKARSLAELVRKDIENTVFQADGHKIGVTVSIGVESVVPTEAMSSRNLISRADEALYLAKSNGRNVVKTWGDLSQQA